jgi:hypothetical protein
MDGGQEVMRRDFAPATPAPFPFCLVRQCFERAGRGELRCTRLVPPIAPSHLQQEPHENGSIEEISTSDAVIVLGAEPRPLYVIFLVEKDMRVPSERGRAERCA